MEINSQVDRHIKELIHLRRDFHQYPELGGKELRTSEKIAQYLNKLGLEVKRLAYTGVVGVLRGKDKGPTLLMRADMDALPIKERNTFYYKSKNRDVMHACGHDGHMAMLLVSAKILSENYCEVKGNIKFVFQPSEENGIGAASMIKEGVLENPSVDAGMGIHLWTQIKSGFIGIKSGAIMTALTVFKIKVIGKGGHTGYPENVIDPIMAASDIIQKMQLIQTRESSQLNPIIIMFGKVKGGTKNNIVPDEVELEGTIRYFKQIINVNGNEVTIEALIRKLVQSIANTHRVKVKIDFINKHVPVTNNVAMTNIIRSTAEKIFDKTNIIEYMSTASEDFSEFSSRIPSSFYFLGCGSADKKTKFPHHNSFFDIDEDVLSLGVEMHVRSALRFLNDWQSFINSN